MSKQRKTAGKTATAGQTAQNTNTRIDRWRRLAEERIAQLEDPPRHNGLDLLRICAEIEGLTPADLIVERLKAERCGGRVVTKRPDSCCGPEWDAYIDTDYEQNAPTQSRNRHEREVVSSMQFHFTFLNIPDHVLGNRGRAFLLRFYRKGDVGLRPAVNRMAEAALAALDCA